MHNGLSPSPTPHDLLDRVLAGKSDEIKARVLELVLRLGISPQDELFLVMIALNHLLLLVEDAPTEWQDLFVEFKGELDRWSDTNLAVLDSLIHKAQNEEALAESCKLLISALANLTTTSNELVRQLQDRSQTSTALPSEQIFWFKEHSQKIEEIAKQQSILHKHMETAIALGQRKSTAKVKLPDWLVVLLFILTATSVVNMCLLLAHR